MTVLNGTKSQARRKAQRTDREPMVQVSALIPERLMTVIDQQAKASYRDRTKQLRHVLERHVEQSAVTP